MMVCGVYVNGLRRSFLVEDAKRGGSINSRSILSDLKLLGNWPVYNVDIVVNLSPIWMNAGRTFPGCCVLAAPEVILGHPRGRGFTGSSLSLLQC